MVHTAAIERLLQEFRAQDLGIDLVVLVGFDRHIVAKFSEGNGNWELTQAGKDLLDPPPPSPPSEDMRAKMSMPRNIDVKTPKK